MKLVVFLQNAWSPLYAGTTWPRPSWLRALARSRSGQRLRNLIGDDYDLVENTTPHVGPTPDSVIEPDDKHIMEIIKRRNPKIVVACGDQARKALEQLWSGPLLCLPHPASRILRNALYEHARRLLALGYGGRLCLVPIKAKTARWSTIEIEKPDCQAARDGECFWKHCPQNRDNEPVRSGRSCPLHWPEEDEI